jgi:Tol biopolymer transport system component
MYRRTLLFILAITLTSLSISCSDTSTGSDPEPEITTGTVEVKTATTGDGTDEDGYSVTLNNSSKDIGINGTVTFEEVEEETYNIELSGLDTRCTIDGDNPVSVDVVAEETIAVEFGISCVVAATENKIAFSSDRDGDSEIYLMKPDGSSISQLTNNTDRDAFPSVSPDGTRIAYAKRVNEESRYKIHVMDADGTNDMELTTAEEGSTSFPSISWSPDGSQLAFGSNRDGNDQVYVMNADGSKQVNISNKNFKEYISPDAWSPDGSKILIHSKRGSGTDFEIYTLNPDGSGAIQITDNSTSENYPAWSPDGTKVVFSSGRDGNNEIYVMNADGTGVIQLTNSRLQNYYAVWSQDGSEIAFSSTRDRNMEIYKINADGSGAAVNLTSNSSQDATPFWSRVME